MFNVNQLLTFFLKIFKETGKTCWILFKIMIPISIVVKIIQELGLLPYIGQALAPIMNLVGLPGEAGLIWATSLVVNIYGGILTYLSLADSMALSSAQLTVLLTMVLVAHTFPIELQIARKAGVKLMVMFLIRFGFAILLGFILTQTYSAMDVLQTKAVIAQKTAPMDLSLMDWAIHEVQNYATIILFIFGLVFILEILKITGIIELINKMLYPVLRLLGIGKEVLPIAVVGLTLGISYGGAIIIKEVNEGKASRRDVFYTMTLMGLCHSMIEDTMLMFAMGGDLSGILFGRIVFALIISFLIVKFTKGFSDNKFKRWFLVHDKYHK
jgi:hypothetical protein